MASHVIGTTDGRVTAHKLDAIGWGLFFRWVGIASLPISVGAQASWASTFSCWVSNWQGNTWAIAHQIRHHRGRMINGMCPLVESPPNRAIDVALTALACNALSAKPL